MICQNVLKGVASKRTPAAQAAMRDPAKIARRQITGTKCGALRTPPTHADAPGVRGFISIG